MPELDGLAATAEIRAEADFDALPIIAMTAHATVEERERCLVAGMQDHIAKPIDPAALYSTVRHHSRRSTEVAAPSRDAANAASSPPVAPGGSTGDDLPAVAGLDTADGLLRLAGNRPLYLKLLRQFVEQQADAPTRLSALLAAGDRATAERLAHSIRGVAGNLGAGPVQAAAAKVEHAIAASAPPADLEAAQNTLDERLTALVGGLRQALGVEAAATATSVDRAPPDPEALAAAIDQLKTYLRDFDAAALDLLEAESALFHSLLGPEAFAGLRQRIEAYAFDDAAAWLDVEVGQTGSEYELGHPVPSTSTAAATDNPQAVQLAIDRLHQYLTDCDAAAVDHLETNRELVRAWFSREAFAELEQRIQAFAFDEARALLEEAMTSHAG